MHPFPPTAETSRVRPVTWVVIFLFAVLLTGGCRPSHTPNVVILVMDTTRADHCSFLGYGRDTTPALTRLAAESTIYEDAWSPAGWTGPAHASLFTGLRPIHHGFLRGVRDFLSPDCRTLATILREHGYSTACFTNNDTLSPPWQLLTGFDRTVPLYAELARPYPWAPETHERALRWALTMHREGKPFFLFINDMEPHYPYTPPEEAVNRLGRNGMSPATESFLRLMPHTVVEQATLGVKPFDAAQLSGLSTLYDAEILTLDDAIGNFVARLRREGLLDETVLVILGDHGENLGDHGLMDHVFSLHRSICHVPLLVRYPPRIEAGRKVADVVRIEDVMPTVLQLLGLPIPEDLDGSSLLGNLSGRVSRGELGPPSVYLGRLSVEYPGRDITRFWSSFRSVYDGRYHLIEDSRGRIELYDVRKDPAESRNLVGRSGAPVAKLVKQLDDF